jgi:arsenite-transporting ATPase
LIDRLFSSIRGRPHVVFVLGKGGVGKTTLSMLTGISLSKYRKVLLVSLDPAKHLAKYVGSEIVEGVVAAGENLVIRQVDLESEIRKYTERYAQWINDLMPSLKVFNIESAADVVRYSPGVEEEVFLNVIRDLYRVSQYDFVIIDTPPTGVSLRTLYLPAVYGVWVDKLVEVREKIVSMRYSIARTLGKEREMRDRVLERLYELRDSYRDLYSRLRDPEHTSYVVVATPEPLPVYELKESVRFIQEKLGSSPRALVLNRYLPKDTARELGVLDSQEQFVEELRRLGFPLLIVEYLGRPTSSMHDVCRLLERVRAA